MADAYRGLTIRIGADETGLTKALSASNKAIAETQRQLSQLKRAANMDGAGIDTMAAQMGVCADRARALDKRVSTLAASLKQVSPEQMQKLSKYTDAAATSAAEAQARYAKVCDEIKALKNEYAKLAGYDVSKNDPFKGVEGYDGTVEVMRRLATESEAASRALAEVSGRYDELNARYKDAAAENALAKQAAGIQNVKVQLASAEAEARSLYMEMARFKTENPLSTQTSVFQRFKDNMESAERATSELRQEIERLDRSLEIDPSNVAVAEQKFRNMAEQVRINLNSMEQLRERMDALKASGADKAVSQFSDLRMEIAKAEDQVASLSRELSVANNRIDEMRMSGVDEMSNEFMRAEDSVASLNAQLQEANIRLDRLGDAKLYANLSGQMANLSAETNAMIGQMSTAQGRFDGMSGTVNQLGWAMYSTLTPAMMMFASSAISSAEDVDASYRNMRKTVQGTEEQFEAMKQSAIDYSRTHFTSADQMLEIEALGGQLGVATDKLETFATVVSNLDIATDLDADTAATQLGQLGGILNDMTEDDFPKFGDALVRLGNNNATLESKITDVMLRIGSMGSIIGFTTPELLAWATAVAATGQGSESAGTAISNSMSDIEGAVGAGGENLKAFADIAQMSAEQFANAWNTDPSSAFYAFIQGLKQIDENGGSADAALEGLGITSVRQKQALLGLMQTIDGLNSNLKMSNDAWNGVSDEFGDAGDAAREAQRKAEGFSGAIQLLRNNFQAFGVEVGESMAPLIEGLSVVVATLTQSFSDLPPQGKAVVDALILIGAAAGPVTVAGQAVAKTIGGINDNLQKAKGAWRTVVENNATLVSAFADQAVAASGATGQNNKLTKSYDDMTRKQKLAAGGATLLKGAIGAIGIGAAVTAVGMLGSALYDAYEKEQTFKQATDGLVDACDAMNQSTRDAADAINSMSTEPARRQYNELRADIDETIQKQAQLADQISTKMGDVAGNSYALETYIGIIEDLTNKFDENGNKITLNIEEQSKLRAAVQGVNDIMGTTYSIVDANNGVLSSSTEEIKKNSDAWILNAQAQAAQESVTDLLKTQLTLQQDLSDAQANYNEKLKAYNDAAEAGLNGDSLGQFAYDLGIAEKAMDDAQSAYDANVESVDKLRESYEFAVASMEANSMAEAVRASQDGLSEMIEGAGISIDDFMLKCAQASVSIDDLRAIGSDNFSQLAQACQGNMDAMVFFIKHYNDTPILDKDGNIQVNQASLIDAQGNVYTWNGTQLLDKDGNAMVDDTSLIDAQGNAWTWNGTDLKPKNSTASVDDKSVQEAIEMRDNWNNGSLFDKVASATINVFRNITDFFTGGHASGGIARNARGGISRHADGGIATGPTMISPTDVIGEDGAEAYVGVGGHNYIVPLTNKRYSSPFVSMLADGVQKRLASDTSPDKVARALSSVSRGGRASHEAFAAKRTPSIGTNIERVEINQRVVQADEDIYVAAPQMARSAAREIRRMGR